MSISTGSKSVDAILGGASDQRSTSQNEYLAPFVGGIMSQSISEGKLSPWIYQVPLMSNGKQHSLW
jgi:hypothetical protein